MTDDQNEQGFAALLYACTTESMIPWEWLEESRDPKLLMTEWERVDVLLRAVNGKRLSVREWSRLCGAPLGGPLKIGGGKLLDLELPLMKQASMSLRKALEGIISRRRGEAAAVIDKNAVAMLRGRLIVVDEAPVQDVPRQRVIAHSIGPALLHSLLLVIDPGRPFRRRLRQCAWPTCGHFALGKPPSGKGQPPKHYCSKSHKEQHRKERLRKWKADERRRKAQGGMAETALQQQRHQ